MFSKRVAMVGKPCLHKPILKILPCSFCHIPTASMKDSMQQKLKEEPCNKAMCTSKANEQLVILTLYKTGSWMYRPNCAYRKFSTVLEMGVLQEERSGFYTNLS